MLSINFTTSISICQNKGFTIIIIQFHFILNSLLINMKMYNVQNRLLSIAYFWLRMGVLLHTHGNRTIVYGRIFSESWSSLSRLTDWNFTNVHCTCIIRLVHLNQFPSIVAPKICGTCPAHVYLQFTTFAHTKQTQHSNVKKRERKKKWKIFSSVACK